MKYVWIDHVTGNTCVADDDGDTLIRGAVEDRFAGCAVREILRLAEENERLKLEKDSSEGVLAMAVARLGGLVEGHPTGRHNFLQRIDALVAREGENERLREAIEKSHQTLACALEGSVIYAVHAVLDALRPHVRPNGPAPERREVDHHEEN